MNKLSFAFLGTTQGKVAVVAYLILFLVLAGSLIYQNQRTKDPAQRVPAEEVFLVILLILLAFGLQAYSISCMVLGQSAGVGCGVLAWVNSIAACVIAAVAVLSVLFRS